MFKGKFVLKEGGKRLDVFIRDMHPGFSRKFVQRAIEKGLIKVNSRVVPKGYVLLKGDVVEVLGIPFPEEVKPLPDETLSLKVLKETEHFVAVEKPPGIPSVPIEWDEKGTVANFISARYGEVFSVGRRGLDGGILNRLDTDVSGFLLCARTQEFFDLFIQWQEEDRVVKTFLALVEGNLKDRVWVTAPIIFLKGREKKVYTRVPKSFRAKIRKEYQAQTLVEPVELKDDVTLVKVEISKASRHQIRAHLAHIGHPVVGDPIYGKRKKDDDSIKLHLWKMRFPSPEGDGEEIVESTLPQWARLKRSS